VRHASRSCRRASDRRRLDVLCRRHRLHGGHDRRGVILNTACSVDHHCRVGDYVHIAPGARIGGEVTIGDRALVGLGAIVLPRVTIGHDAVVGAGAVR